MEANKKSLRLPRSAQLRNSDRFVTFLPTSIMKIRKSKAPVSPGHRAMEREVESERTCVLSLL